MKAKILNKIILAILVLALLMFASTLINTDLVSAQSTDALSINISPPVSYLYLKPGAGISAPIYLENQGRYTLSVSAQFVDFRPDQETGQVLLQQSSDFKYLSIAGDHERWGKEFIIRPGEAYTLPLTIALPADFPQGEYYLSVLFNVEQMLLEDVENNANTILSGVVASHLVLAVNLDEADRSQIVIKDFKLPKVVDSLMGIDFRLWAKNIGLNAGPVAGKLTISHWPSPAEQEYEFYPDMVLANSQRQVRGMSADNLDHLKSLSEQEEVMTANGENFLAVQSQFLDNNLLSDFSYKKPFLLGAYDFRVELGDETQVERVVALPISIVLVLILLPILYRLFTFLLKSIAIKKNNDPPIIS
ncbi:MAG: hypothetical protein GX559_03375 [Candidatus Pacebacteria bacterium]|nr:hypothetical protein [Candidatus Paceibacterota bacterium]